MANDSMHIWVGLEVFSISVPLFLCKSVPFISFGRPHSIVWDFPHPLQCIEMHGIVILITTTIQWVGVLLSDRGAHSLLIMVPTQCNRLGTLLFQNCHNHNYFCNRIKKSRCCRQIKVYIHSHLIISIGLVVPVILFSPKIVRIKITFATEFNELGSYRQI